MLSHIELNLEEKEKLFSMAAKGEHVETMSWMWKNNFGVRPKTLAKTLAKALARDKSKTIKWFSDAGFVINDKL